MNQPTLQAIKEKFEAEILRIEIQNPKFLIENNLIAGDIIGNVKYSDIVNGYYPLIVPLNYSTTLTLLIRKTFEYCELALQNG